MTRQQLRILWLGFMGLAILAVNGCSESDENIAIREVQTPRLPISLNEMMVALVNPAADPIWVADWKRPESEMQWRNLEHLAKQLEVAGALLKLPGTGPLDEAWVADARWQQFADRLQNVGRETLVAVGTRDHDAIRLAGDDLVTLCEDCHKVFKPSIPTGKIYGDPSPIPDVEQ